LFIKVGQCHKPDWEGKGGLILGSILFPSITSQIDVSSPAKYPPVFLKELLDVFLLISLNPF